MTAVVAGLAAQQTLANVIAGTVLLSARPFRVGERVRLQGGGLAGSVVTSRLVNRSEEVPADGDREPAPHGS